MLVMDSSKKRPTMSSYPSSLMSVTSIPYNLGETEIAGDRVHCSTLSSQSPHMMVMLPRGGVVELATQTFWRKKIKSLAPSPSISPISTSLASAMSNQNARRDVFAETQMSSRSEKSPSSLYRTEINIPISLADTISASPSQSKSPEAISTGFRCTEYVST